MRPAAKRASARCALVVLMALGAFLFGCAHRHVRSAMNAAASRLDEAREMGAEAHAPFEYYAARERLRLARAAEEEASYAEAVAGAEAAERYAARAVDAVRVAKRDGRAGVVKP